MPPPATGRRHSSPALYVNRLTLLTQSADPAQTDMAFSLNKALERDWVPRFKKCCCIYSLHTGSLVIAWVFTMLCLIGAAIKICSSPFIVAYLDKKVKETHMIAEMVEEMHQMNNQTDAPNPGLEVDPEYEMMMARTSLATIIVLLCSSCIVNILLLIGIHKKTHCLMMPWLIVKALTIAGGIYLLIKFISIAFYSLNLLLLYCVALSVETLLIYFYLVVYSHYRDVKEVYVKSEDNFGRLDEEA